jgi:hypothetical protein
MENSPEYIDATLEVQREKEKQDRLLRQYPPFKQLFERISLRNQPHAKRAVAKRLHICVEYLSMHKLNDDNLPSLEECLAMLGGAHMSLALIEEMKDILSNVPGSSFSAVLPREAVQLRNLCRKRVHLEEQLVLALTFQKVKEKGLFEEKPQTV